MLREPSHPLGEGVGGGAEQCQAWDLLYHLLVCLLSEEGCTGEEAGEDG